MTTDRLSAISVTIVSVALLGAVISVSRARPRLSVEQRVWRLMSVAVATLAGGALLAELLGNFAFNLAGLIACAIFYQALVQWNHTRSRPSERGDLSESLNGVSAVLVLTALGNLLLNRFSPPAPAIALWQTQAALLTCSALVVVLGAAASISVIGGLIRDARLWLITVALSLVTGAELVALIADDHGAAVTRPAWLFAGGLILSCTLIAPGAGSVRSGTSQATILGALLVQVSGVVLLAADNRLGAGNDPLATGYALAGVFGASVRVLRLVSDLAHLAQSRHEAMTDELTGIPNRRALLMAMDDVRLRARAASLLIVDLDRFKEINDRYGHAAGDRLLRHTAGMFASRVPDRAFLARLGGDEFAVLLTDDDTVAAADLAGELAAAAAAPLSDLKGRLLQVGASIGIATVPMPGISGGELLRRADTAMYQAKTSGSGVRIYDSALDAAAQDRLELIEDLRTALKDRSTRENQILIHFQPQLNLATGAVVGAEALVRWQHPRLGLLTPDLFVDLAEQNGLMPALTAFVLREAGIQTGRWRASGHRLRVSVNLSAGGLADRALLGLIDEVLADGVPAPDLILEVTETCLMKNPVQALEAMHRIAARGVGISIDDYGTGYSSLSYMNDLPATELKIDRCFTARMTSDPRTAAIVAGTVELAHRLGMRLIAEGVEDGPTLAMIAELGCDDSQGYLHSRPLPAEDFLSWLNARNQTFARAATNQSPASSTSPSISAAS